MLLVLATSCALAQQTPPPAEVPTPQLQAPAPASPPPPTSSAPSNAAIASSPASLSLENAVERALAANPTIAAARLRGAIDTASLAVAREFLNPEADLEVEKETPKQALTMAVPLELGGKRAKRIAVSRATLSAGEAELALVIVQIRNDVRRAYDEVLLAGARLGVLRESRDLSKRARDAAQTRFDAGDAPRLEVLQAGLGLGAAENEAMAAEGVLLAATTRLNVLLAQPLDTVQTLTTPIDAGSQVAVDQAVEISRQSSAELALLDRQIDEQRARVALAHALRTPDVTPRAAVTHDSEPDFTWGWRAGLAVTLPVFTTHKAGVQLEQATLDQLTARRHEAQTRITAEVTAAAATAEAQRQAYARYRDQILPQAQQVEQLAQDSYELGQTGIVALLQALQSSRDARLRSLDAASQLLSARADLERAIGASLP